MESHERLLRRIIRIRELTFKKVTRWKYKLNIWEISEISSVPSRQFSTRELSKQVVTTALSFENSEFYSNNSFQFLKMNESRRNLFDEIHTARKKAQWNFYLKKETTFHRPNIFEKKASCFSFRKNAAAAWKLEKSMERRFRASSGHRRADR